MLLNHSFQLEGWIGLSYNERLRVSELPPSPSTPTPSLPVLYFSLAYGSRPVALPLEALVLDQLQVNSSAGGASSSSTSSQTITRRLCVQRSSSIVQDGATVFAVLESDAGTVQRYRMQGSLSLPLYNMVQAPVVLGAMAITAIGGISVNGANRSFAMAVRSAAELGTDDQAVATCAAEESACIGEQQFVESTNKCDGKAVVLLDCGGALSDGDGCVLVQTPTALSTTSTRSTWRPSAASSCVPPPSPPLVLAITSNLIARICPDDRTPRG